MTLRTLRALLSGVAAAALGAYWGPAAGASGAAGGRPVTTAAASPGPSARGRSGADTVEITASPPHPQAGGTVDFTVHAGATRARGALTYRIAFGDGSTASPPVPEFCLRRGQATSQTWRLTHRYSRPGTFWVSVTVSAVCTPGSATARLALPVG